MSTCLVRLLDDLTITSQSTLTMNLSFERRAHRRSGSTTVLPLKKLAEKPFFFFFLRKDMLREAG